MSKHPTGRSPRKPAPSVDAQIATLRRMQAQQEAMGEVSAFLTTNSGDLADLCRLVTRIAAATTSVERASIWRLSDDGKRLTCLDLFERSRAQHASGAVLDEAEYQKEFAALRGVSYVAADDPVHDPRTSGYAETYLKPLGITSMLDALIQASGRQMGLLCLEHVNTPHAWESDEISFACQLADKVALGLLAQSHREALAAAEASAQLHRSILHASPDGLAITDLGGRVLMLSPASQRMLRSESIEALEGRPITDFIVPEDRPLALARMTAMFNGERTGANEYHGLRLDGTTFDIDVNAEFIPGPDGAPTGYVFVVRDVTERREARNALQRSNDLLRSIVETVPSRIFWKDANLRFLGCNTPFARDAGHLRPEEIVGKTDFDMVWRDHAEQYRADDRAVMESGTARLDYEEPQTTPDGGTIWLSTSKVPLRDDQGRVCGIVGSYYDITLRKEANEALRESLIEKDFLLGEIHHRVKNNLQVINSLLRLEAGRSPEPAVRAALGEMQGRVLSIAVLHETLYRTRKFGRVDLAGYLKDLAHQFFRAQAGMAASVRLTLDLQPVEVRIDQGVPCGLILSELMSNSFKHAFTPGREGEIRVVLRREPNREVLMQVSDDGPGLPADFEARRLKSLGMQLVADLARQIGGGLEVGPGPGARFDLRFATATGERPRPGGSAARRRMAS